MFQVILAVIVAIVVVDETNVTIVVVTIIQFTSSRGVVNDFSRGLSAEGFLKTRVLLKWGPSTGVEIHCSGHF